MRGSDSNRPEEENRPILGSGVRLVGEEMNAVQSMPSVLVALAG